MSERHRQGWSLQRPDGTVVAEDGVQITDSGYFTVHSHEALTFVAGLGQATTCGGYGVHRPTPMRYVWHHILPQACGGKTIAANLVSLCDTCHYATHALLYAAGLNGVVPSKGTRAQRRYALAGYQAAITAGTVDRIPDEGSIG